MKAAMTKLGLTLNEAKPSVRDARNERFDFLGYTFGPHRDWKDRHWYPGADFTVPRQRDDDGMDVGEAVVDDPVQIRAHASGMNPPTESINLRS